MSRGAARVHSAAAAAWPGGSLPFGAAGPRLSRVSGVFLTRVSQMLSSEGLSSIPSHQSTGQEARQGAMGATVFSF